MKHGLVLAEHEMPPVLEVASISLDYDLLRKAVKQSLYSSCETQGACSV